MNVRKWFQHWLPIVRKDLFFSTNGTFCEIYFCLLKAPWANTRSGYCPRSYFNNFPHCVFVITGQVWRRPVLLLLPAIHHRQRGGLPLQLPQARLRVRQLRGRAARRLILAWGQGRAEDLEKQVCCRQDELECDTYQKKLSPNEHLKGFTKNADWLSFWWIDWWYDINIFEGNNKSLWYELCTMLSVLALGLFLIMKHSIA